MWNIGGIVMALAGYAAVLLFLGRVAWRALVLMRTPPEPELGRRRKGSALVLAVADVLFLRRLFLVNKPLWFGEWVFHVSFVLVTIRHLRYFLLPVPDWIVCVQPAGVWAGYALAASLVYIMVVRFLLQRTAYVSGENLRLSGLFLALGGTGLGMRWLSGFDIVRVKEFVLRCLAFSPGPAPDSGVFALHFLLACAVVAMLPSHMMSAPYTTYDARARDEGLGGILHD